MYGLAASSSTCTPAAARPQPSSLSSEAANAGTPLGPPASADGGLGLPRWPGAAVMWVSEMEMLFATELEACSKNPWPLESNPPVWAPPSMAYSSL